MSGKNITFDDKKINNRNFYKTKNLFCVFDIEADKILISKKEPHGKRSSFNYFLGHNADDVIRSLCIKLSQIVRYVNYFDSN